MVQFAPIPAFTPVHFGLLWQRIRDKFPGMEQHAPVPHVVERFGNLPQLFNRVHFQLTDQPPSPRCWFKTADETELIQLQSDRFMHSWRKVKGDQIYPRYEEIKKRFESELEELTKFLGEEKLGRLLPDQCEVTYVNHIVKGEGWDSIGELGRVLTLWSGACNDQFLPDPESVKISQQYVIRSAKGESVGRFYLDLQSGVRMNDGKEVFVLTMTSRLRPGGEGIADVMESLDLGREWIVKSFSSVTTEAMHRQWERTSDA